MYQFYTTCSTLLDKTLFIRHFSFEFCFVFCFGLKKSCEISTLIYIHCTSSQLKNRSPGHSFYHIYLYVLGISRWIMIFYCTSLIFPLVNYISINKIKTLAEYSMKWLLITIHIYIIKSSAFEVNIKLYVYIIDLHNQVLNHFDIVHILHIHLLRTVITEYIGSF